MSMLSNISEEQVLIVFALVLVIGVIAGIVQCFRASHTLGVISIFAACTGAGAIVLVVFTVVRLLSGKDFAQSIAREVRLRN